MTGRMRGVPDPRFQRGDRVFIVSQYGFLTGKILGTWKVDDEGSVYRDVLSDQLGYCSVRESLLIKTPADAILPDAEGHS